MARQLTSSQEGLAESKNKAGKLAQEKK